MWKPSFKGTSSHPDVLNTAEHEREAKWNNSSEGKLSEDCPEVIVAI